MSFEIAVFQEQFLRVFHLKLEINKWYHYQLKGMSW